MFMNNTSPPLHFQNRKSSFSWLWALSTALLCALFIVALAPGVDAQNQDTRRYSSTMQNVFDFIQRHYVEEVDPKTVFEGAMSGMLNSLGDPHSNFLSEKEMTDLSDITQGTFGGVGLYISKPVEERTDGQTSYAEVSSPIEDTPGWRAGINPGDLIIEINGENTGALSLDEVVARLRGAPGEAVNIKIRRGARLEFPVTLVREVINVPTIKYDMIGDIGYLRLINFTPMTSDLSREALNGFKAKNYRGLILDLRNNGGGLLQAAIGICDLFLDSGVVVSTKSRIPSENTVFSAHRSTVVPADIPVIVLINRGSASASEIVAGALKDRGRAYLVGERSYGKGSVQQVFPLDKAGFKLTTARYYTPSDVNIDKIGIPPDREVKFPEFTAEDAEKFNTLMTANKIAEFIGANPRAGIADIDIYARELGREYGIGNISLLRRLIRDEQNRTVIAPVYDLEYDIQLQEGINIIRGGDYRALMQSAKTLKTLQEEAAGDQPQAS
jgi:carboxyl-terminal processing protease